ncbi:multiple epidermal growth factor-like domains protein 11 [Ptychodera flava]|uniref:multiple epidermal growth factor-like domains protein 11 n=1 Tax=Ptychodera flava TaxID=63121 RepID=UPI003969E7A7
MWMDLSNMHGDECIATVFANKRRKSGIPWDRFPNFRFGFVGQKSGNVVDIGEVKVYQKDDSNLPKSKELNYTSIFSLDRVLIESHIPLLPVYRECQSSCDIKVWDKTTDDTLLSFTIDKAELLGCPEGKYGGMCNRDCICQNGATCHIANGACKCTPGWKGVACDIPDRGVFIRLTQSREAKVLERRYFNCFTKHIMVANISWYFNNTKIKRLTTVPYLNSKGSWGLKLEMRKLLENNTGIYRCSAVDAEGEVYSASTILKVKGCQTGFWGKDCDNRCNCKHGSRCDRYYGCQCTAGWKGRFCDSECDIGTFGLNCANVCKCENEATCYSVNGHCQCSNRTCGVYCEHRCHCTGYQRSVCTLDNLCTCETDGMDTYHIDNFYIGIICSTFSFMIVIITIVTLTLRCRRRHKTRYNRLSTKPEDVEKLFSRVKEKLTVSGWLIHINKIQIGNVIGRGEFAEINVAEWRQHGCKRKVALKSIAAGMGNLQDLDFD